MSTVLNVIYAVAEDNSGNKVVSDVITVSVVPGTEAPVVTLNDLNGTHFVGDTVYLYASPVDNASTGGEG